MPFEGQEAWVGRFTGRKGISGMSTAKSYAAALDLSFSAGRVLTFVELHMNLSQDRLKADEVVLAYRDVDRLLRASLDAVPPGAAVLKESIELMLQAHMARCMEWKIPQATDAETHTVVVGPLDLIENVNK